MTMVTNPPATIDDSAFAVRRTSSGLGLVSMEERARAVGTQVHISSRPRHGTTIRVRGPADNWSGRSDRNRRSADYLPR